MSPLIGATWERVSGKEMERDTVRAGQGWRAGRGSYTLIVCLTRLWLNILCHLFALRKVLQLWQVTVVAGEHIPEGTAGIALAR